MRLRILSGSLLILLSALPLFAFSPADKSPPEVTVSGRIVCLSDAGVPVACDPASGEFALKTSDGKTFRFLKDDPGQAILMDPRVRERELQIRALLYPENRLEIIKTYSVHGGKIFDLYYFCEVCNITVYAPGLCPCCRSELEFKEIPLEER